MGDDDGIAFFQDVTWLVWEGLGTQLQFGFWQFSRICEQYARQNGKVNVNLVG